MNKASLLAIVFLLLCACGKAVVVADTDAITPLNYNSPGYVLVTADFISEDELAVICYHVFADNEKNATGVGYTNAVDLYTISTGATKRVYDGYIGGSPWDFKIDYGTDSFLIQGTDKCVLFKKSDYSYIETEYPLSNWLSFRSNLNYDLYYYIDRFYIEKYDSTSDETEIIASFDYSSRDIINQFIDVSDSEDFALYTRVYGYYYFENYIIDLTNKNAICLHDTDSIAYWAGDDIVLMNEGGINTDYGSLTTMEINGDIVIGSLRAEQYVKLLDTQEDALLYVYPDILHIADDVYQISSQLLLINNIKLDNEIVLTDQFNWFNTAKFNAEGSKIVFVAVPKDQGEGVAKLYLLNL